MTRYLYSLRRPWKTSSHFWYKFCQQKNQKKKLYTEPAEWALTPMQWLLDSLWELDNFPMTLKSSLNLQRPLWQLWRSKFRLSFKLEKLTQTTFSLRNGCLSIWSPYSFSLIHYALMNLLEILLRSLFAQLENVPQLNGNLRLFSFHTFGSLFSKRMQVK